MSPSLARRYGRPILASLVLTAGFVFVMRAGSLPVMPAGGAIAHMLWWPAAGFLVAMLASMLLKYLRAYFSLAPVARIPIRRIMNISCIAMGLVTILPLRLGEAARPAMLRERGKVSGWAVAATVGAERIIDGVAFGVLLLAGLALAPPHEPLPDHIGGLAVPAALVPRAAVTATAVFGVAMLVMVVFYWRRALARSLTERMVGVVSKRLAIRIATAIERMSDGLRFLTDARHSGPYIAVTVASIAANVWAIQLLAIAVGIPALDFAQSSVVLGVLALGFALPNAPGFFGAVQLCLYAGLVLYLPPVMITREGATFVFAYYVGYLGVVLSLALGGFLLEYVLPKASSQGSVATPAPLER
jgi:glycosyltransferase 2 family protein